MVTAASMREYEWRLIGEAEASREWDGWLAALPGAHPRQSYAWGRYKQGAWQARRMALIKSGRPAALALCLVRRAPLSAATVAWINAGPVFDPRLGPQALRLFLEGLKEHLRGEPRPILRVSPALPKDPALESLLREAGFVSSPSRLDSGRTLVLDLEPSLEDLRRGLDRKWRNQLKAAEGRGPEFSAGRGADILARYLRLHEAMCRRKGLAGQKLTLEGLKAMAEGLGGRIVFLVGSAAGRDGCGGALLTFADGAILWHSAADDWGLENCLANAFYWEAVKRLKAAGVRRFDLGGVDPVTGRGVAHFKAGLGAAPVEWLGEWDWSPSPLARAGFNWALKALRGRLP